MAAHRIPNQTERDETTGFPDIADEAWQQPQLLAAPDGTRREAATERRRRAGLLGIAKARAALAEAARRAEDARPAARERDWAA